MPSKLAGLIALVAAATGLACGGQEEQATRSPPPVATISVAHEAPGQDAPQRPGLFAFGAAEARPAGGELVVGTNPLLAWRDLEPQEGVYDWTLMDDAIDAAAGAGSKVAPRILTNASLYGQPAPDWFFETASGAHYYPSAEAEAQGFKAPVAWDPIFQAKFGAFLQALGERYDGNAAIEYFQTNAGGGLYGEIVVTKDYSRFPPGWSAEVQRDSIIFWLERWLEAFPSTNLSLMVNHVGDGIGEEAAAYAAGAGVFLQQNTPWLPPEGVAIFRTYQASTKIVLEAEDGCNSTKTEAFDQLVATVFSYGFAIDYLHLCAESFDDEATAAKLPAIQQRLRQ